MKKLFFLFLLITSTKMFSQSTDSIAIIPQPVSLSVSKGYFTLPEKIVITSNVNSPEVKNIITQLSKQLTTATGYSVSTQKHTDLYH